MTASRAETVTGADGRIWLVWRTVAWDTPHQAVEEFEHDIDGGRGGAPFIILASALLWLVLLFGAPSRVHIPIWLLCYAVIFVMFFPLRWLMRRPWIVVAETSEENELPAERWTSEARGWISARAEQRRAVERLRAEGGPADETAPKQPQDAEPEVT